MADSTTTANQASAIGYVKLISGQVTAIDSAGVERVLQLGDTVFADDVVMTSSRASVVIELRDGTNLTMGGGGETLLNDEVYDPAVAQDIADRSSNIDALQQAILAGADPTQVLDAPAAGAGEAAGDGNQGTVSVERTGAETTPESGFETTGLNQDAEVPQAQEGGLSPTGTGTGTDTSPANNPPVASATTVVVQEDGVTVAGPVALATDGAVMVLSVAITEPNQVFSFDWQFNAGDYLPYNDFAFVQIDGQPAMTLSDVASVGNYGNSGPQNFSFEFVTPGTYQVVIGISDVGDTGVNSSLVITNLPADLIVSTTSVGSASEAGGAWTLTTNGADNSTLNGVLGQPAGQLQASDIDAGAVLTFGLVGDAPAGFVLNSDGSWTFDPSDAAYQSLAVGASQVLVIPYTVTDEHGAMGSSTLTITVMGANDGPVAVDDTVAATEDTPATYTLADLVDP
ncbi:retention module-containing protein, partial [Sedimenticola hydrogenitrophicus]|uniref:retention module-containing protein n=1 Tax=Sedimenticola hydrogenitrophicus TaxID=2967975 RepID=UPI0021A35C92